jgi:hypothetical protein
LEQRDSLSDAQRAEIGAMDPATMDLVTRGRLRAMKQRTPNVADRSLIDRVLNAPPVDAATLARADALAAQLGKTRDEVFALARSFPDWKAAQGL